MKETMDQKWTLDYLADQQNQDSDLRLLKQWMTDENGKPVWDIVRAHSPALRLTINNGIPSSSKMEFYIVFLREEGAGRITTNY